VKDLREFTSIESENINHSYYAEIRMSITEEVLQNSNKSSAMDYCLDEIHSILNSSDDAMGNKNLLLSRYVVLFFPLFFFLISFSPVWQPIWPLELTNLKKTI
jgi:hypothetical protein